MTPAMDADAVAVGKHGELALQAWLKDQRLLFVHVSQDPDSFAPLFRSEVKRPDFLLLLEGVGLIAVDSKNKALWRDELSLDITREIKKSLMFERVFRLPLWYAPDPGFDANSQIARPSPGWYAAHWRGRCLTTTRSAWP